MDSRESVEYLVRQIEVEVSSYFLRAVQQSNMGLGSLWSIW